MRKIFEWVITFPKTVLFVLLLLTFSFASQLSKTTMETDAESMIPQEHPAIVYNEQAEEIFGIHDALIIGIVNEGPDGIFNPQTLERVKRLTARLVELEGVVAVSDDDVISLATIDNISGTAFGFEVAPFMEEVPATAEALKELRRKLFDNEMYVGGIVAGDGTATAIYAELENGLDSRARVYQKVKALVHEEMKGGGADRIYIAGRPVLEVTFGEYMAADMQRMMPLVIVVVILVLFLIFRSLAGVLLPFAVVIGSVIWAMGIMALCKVPLFTISTQMPVILMAIGTAYGIHIINKYFQEKALNPDMDQRQLVLMTMEEMWKPVVMTALTTAVGFLSLVTAYMVPIRYFGVFTAVGVLAAMLFSLLMIPACLMIFRIKVRFQRTPSGQKRSEGPLARILSRAAGFIFHNRRAVTITTLALMALALCGLVRISTNSSWIESIKRSSDVYIANDVLNQKFDGTLNLYVIIEGRQAGDMKSPAVLRAIDRLQAHVEQLPLVGGSRSVAEYLKRMHRVMHADQKTFETVPDSRELVAQYLLMYSMSGDPEDFDDVIDYDYRLANIWVQMKSDYTDDIAAVIRQVRSFAAHQSLPADVKLNLAGRAYTSFEWVELLIRGQMNSILFSILAVFIITAAMFRSLVAGLFNIIPISAAMLLNFGLMGLLGYPLDVSTALSSGIVIGVGIDYTIHFISKYRLEAGRQPHREAATATTMVTTGRAILFNALAVIAGFMVLYTSNFPANQQLGGLVSINMFTCFVAAMTILPALLNIFKPKFIFKSQKEGEQK